MTNPQHEALVEALGKGAVNVERARMNGIAEYLAGWEHKTMLEAADAIAALSATAATLSEEVVRLRAALEPFAEVAAWAERNGHDLAKDFDMLLRGPGNAIAGHLHAQAADFIRARAALEPQAKDG